MQLEIEKKYNLTDEDYKIIKEKCELLEKKEVRDYYLDDIELTLFKNNHRLRLRNGMYELKIKADKGDDGVLKSIEIDDEEKIEEKLSHFKLSTDDVTGVLEVLMDLQKYSYIYEGYEYIIDVQDYKYGKGYEIELSSTATEETNGSELIENLRNHLGLTAPEELSSEGKVITCAMHENFALYEVLLESKN